MKINELVGEFSVYVTNEEENLLDSFNEVRSYNSFNERDQVVLDNLINKGLVKRKLTDEECLVKKNEKISKRS